MRKLLFLGVPMAALLAGAAAAITLSSEIKAIDAKLGIIILSNGATYELAPGVDAGKLRPGDKVTIDYEQIGAHSLISNIKKVK